jgi:hypothetical protein
MKTEEEIRKQLDDITRSKDVGLRYQRAYVAALEWVLEES